MPDDDQNVSVGGKKEKSHTSIALPTRIRPILSGSLKKREGEDIKADCKKVKDKRRTREKGKKEGRKVEKECRRVR